MAATQQPPTPPAGQPAPASGQGPAQTCTTCGAPLAPDQRYCLSCGARRGEPRVPLADTAATAPTAPAAAEPPARQPSEVSPLAAVIGIALLGGMLLIGVLIGRGVNDDPPPASVVQVEPSATTPAPGAGGEEEAVTDVTSEWPQGTDGFTIQLNTLPKDGSTPESVDAARQQAIDDGAADAAVLDSDLYSSLPPGNYLIYSGVYTDRKSAEVALKGLDESFPTAAVVEVSEDGGEGSASGTDAPGTGDTSTAEDAIAPVTPEAESAPPAGSDNGGATSQERNPEESR